MTRMAQRLELATIKLINIASMRFDMVDVTAWRIEAQLQALDAPGLSSQLPRPHVRPSRGLVQSHPIRVMVRPHMRAASARANDKGSASWMRALMGRLCRHQTTRLRGRVFRSI